MKTVIKPEEHKTIRKLIQTKTLKEVAELYGVSRERIRQILLKYGEKPPKRKRYTIKCAIKTCQNTFTRQSPHYLPLCTACRAYNRHREANPDARHNRRKHEQKALCLYTGCTRVVRAKKRCSYHYNRDLIFTKPHSKEKHRLSVIRYQKKRYDQDPLFRARRLAYAQEYQKNNADKIRAQQRARYAKNKEARAYCKSLSQGVDIES